MQRTWANGASAYYLKVTSFDDYLASVPEHQRAELERIRHIVRNAVPSAQESVSYGMPAFKYRGRPLLGSESRATTSVSFHSARP